jgi:hypothetical protein
MACTQILSQLPPLHLFSSLPLYLSTSVHYQLPSSQAPHIPAVFGEATHSFLHVEVRVCKEEIDKMVTCVDT